MRQVRTVWLRAAVVGAVGAQPGHRAGQTSPGFFEELALDQLLDRLGWFAGSAGEETPAEVVATDNDSAGCTADHMDIADQLVGWFLDREPDVQVSELPVTGSEQFRELLRPGLHSLILRYRRWHGGVRFRARAGSCG
ncbi:hypothetical protein GCM10009804_71450 [Kribbella hippodromi]|uniref:Uncharacterized protein n=1 Tax=Kribbella hippodromi TaxID=434347 RepID=A0ABP4QAJ8_9ACTN